MEQEITNINEVAAKYYTISEVSAIFNVDRRTIYRWINRGRLRRCRIIKKSYIPKGDVTQLIEKFQEIRAPRENL